MRRPQETPDTGSERWTTSGGSTNLRSRLPPTPPAPIVRDGDGIAQGANVAGRWNGGRGREAGLRYSLAVTFRSHSSTYVWTASWSFSMALQWSLLI